MDEYQGCVESVRVWYVAPDPMRCSILPVTSVPMVETLVTTTRLEVLNLERQHARLKPSLLRSFLSLLYINTELLFNSQLVLRPLPTREDGDFRPTAAAPPSSPANLTQTKQNSTISFLFQARGYGSDHKNNKKPTKILDRKP